MEALFHDCISPTADLLPEMVSVDVRTVRSRELAHLGGAAIILHAQQLLARSIFNWIVSISIVEVIASSLLVFKGHSVLFEFAGE